MRIAIRVIQSGSSTVVVGDPKIAGRAETDAPGIDQIGIDVRSFACLVGDQKRPFVGGRTGKAGDRNDKYQDNHSGGQFSTIEPEDPHTASFYLLIEVRITPAAGFTRAGNLPPLKRIEG